MLSRRPSPLGAASDGGVAEDLFDRLTRQPVDPTGEGDIAFADFRFPTPSGKIEFASEEAARLWGLDAVPEYVPLPEGYDSPLSARFPLQLLSCKTRDRIHSQFGNLDWVREVERPHTLDLHPADASARGLANGDTAIVWNDRGRITLPVRLDEGLRPGVVHVLEGRCHEGDADINQLTDAGVTDINHGATFYECLVEVARAEGRPAHAPKSAAVVPALRREPVQVLGGLPEGPGGEQLAPDAQAAPAARNGFLLDLGRCVGCGACVLACRLENGWSSENPWRRVLPLNLRRRPNGPTYFLSVACHHCEHPACLAACPSRAYEKLADGTVVHHADRCIGCRYCEMACPFGAPRYDAATGLMTKCDFCQHRNDGGSEDPPYGKSRRPSPLGAAPPVRLQGREPQGASRKPDPVGPACVSVCPTEALRALPGASQEDARELTPGFLDPAGCRPTLRFVAPRGRRRAALYGQLRATLRRSS